MTSTPKKSSFLEMSLFMSLFYPILPLLLILLSTGSISHLPLLRHLLLIFLNHLLPNFHHLLYLVYLKLLTLHLLESHLELDINLLTCRISFVHLPIITTSKYPLSAFHSYYLTLILCLLCPLPLVIAQFLIQDSSFIHCLTLNSL